jgi:gamma-glutamyl-gamma-aminobutyrate hydrolase PuuD
VPTHTIHLLQGSAIAQITGQTELFTNTHHHQAVKQAAPGFRITAWATDSIPEAIENINGKPIWGVQFHPEALTVAGDSISARFFHFLVDKATAFRRSK